MAKLASSKSKSRWVVKAGSQMVCSGGPLLIRAWMQQIAELKRKRGIEVIWVTSGAIASAVDRTGFSRRNRELSEKQALSAIGQPLVMDLYNLSLQSVGLLGAQVLLTYDDIAHAKRRANFQATINRLLSWDVTPVLNENDAVATEEIKFGDNDSLSAKVARVTGADRLVILTDVDGYFERDPRSNPGAKRVPSLERVTAAVLAGAKPAQGASTGRGTGGMQSKLLAAREANRAGIETWFARGDLPSVLTRVADNEMLGTRIGASTRAVPRRKK